MSVTDDVQADQHLTTGMVASQISKGAVGILSRHTGRGPTKVRTYINDDLVSILLRDLLTPGERTLADHGKTQTVLENRRAFQDTMRQELVEVVEHQTGRKVMAFLSANHLEPDVEVEMFLLEPATDGSRARG